MLEVNSKCPARYCDACIAEHRERVVKQQSFMAIGLLVALSVLTVVVAFMLKVASL